MILGNDEGQECPPLGKQKAEPVGPWHPACCSIPWLVMTACFHWTHSRWGQGSSCLGVMAPEKEESPSGHWKLFPCPTIRKLLADPVLWHT